MLIMQYLELNWKAFQISALELNLNGALGNFWETLLIFEITETNTPLPKSITPLYW